MIVKQVHDKRNEILRITYKPWGDLMENTCSLLKTWFYNLARLSCALFKARCSAVDIFSIEHTALFWPDSTVRCCSLDWNLVWKIQLPISCVSMNGQSTRYGIHAVFLTRKTTLRFRKLKYSSDICIRSWEWKRLIISMTGWTISIASLMLP